MNKKYYSSISSKDFIDLPDLINGKVKVDRKRLSASGLFASLDSSCQESLMSFEEKGYAIIRNFLSDEMTEKINDEIFILLKEKKIRFRSGRKLMCAIHASKFLWDIGNDNQLKEVISALLGAPAILFQSINFLKGSEQKTHSDSIHMTTYPLGGLVGVWLALEDVTDDNGPLHYYPGSHRLPYYLNADYCNEGNGFLLGSKTYDIYEDMIRKKIQEHHFPKLTFHAKKGDLLFWHANLFHGGEPHIDSQKTRKSMVFHYFKEGSVCYHEISQRPALINSKFKVR